MGAVHATGRNLDRHLMFLDHHGSMTVLTPHRARRAIKAHRSIRRAAHILGVPKSTLWDLAHDVGKRGRARRQTNISLGR